MVDQTELLQAAQALGEALNAAPEVQVYLRAKEACEQSEEVRQLSQRVDQVYADLIARQQGGELLIHREVNEFYKLRDQLISHPLVQQREESLQAVKALCEQAGGQMSSILSVDYTLLAEE